MKIIVLIILTILINQEVMSHVIYGTDDRKEFFEIIDPLIIQQTEATATFSLKGLINRRSDGDYNLAKVTAGESLHLCPEVKFRDQPTIGACSSTLISPRHLLTAGHCMPDQKRCDEIYIMFGYHNFHEGVFPQFAPAKDVYQCKKLLVRQQNDHLDFALIELDRDVTDRIPVTLGMNEKVNRGDKVRLIGYPDGMPSKIVSNGIVRSSTHKKFVSNVDAFKGNSGSAVFSESTGALVGVLFKGNNDYVYDRARECRKLNICPDSGCRGEDASQISAIWPFISHYLGYVAE